LKDRHQADNNDFLLKSISPKDRRQMNRQSADNNDFPRIEKSLKIMNHSFGKPSKKIDHEFPHQLIHCAWLCADSDLDNKIINPRESRELPKIKRKF
jgi:hypothetical protein